MYQMTTLFDRGFARSAIKKLDNNKLLFIVGPRKSGKSQLIDELLVEENAFPNDSVKVYNCDVHNVRKILNESHAKDLANEFAKYSAVIIEEAHSLDDLDHIMCAIKLCTQLPNRKPGQRILITMSAQPFRKPRYLSQSDIRYENFYLFPISLLEIAANSIEDNQSIDIERAMRFGLYPHVWEAPDDKAPYLLEVICSEYLYRDLFEREGLKKPSALREILRLLALNIGDEISISKLSKQTGLDSKTLERYINLLIEAFIIFRVRPMNRRGSSEVKTKDKFFFYDLGIRNCLLDSYGRIDNRSDRDKLWLNFCIAERMKANLLKGRIRGRYFWRTHGNQHIDMIEEEANWIVPYKISWNDIPLRKPEKLEAKTPPTFSKLYGIEKQMVVGQDTILDFLKQ